MTFRVLAPLALLLLGLGSGWLSGSGYGNRWFDMLAKPWFMPPGWLFPLAWTTLYILMGIALADLVAVGRSGRRAVGWFAVQFALNLVWSPTFFAAHRIGPALAIIVALDVALLATIAAAWRVRPRAAVLLLPYAAWLALATALNLAILRLNP